MKLFPVIAQKGTKALFKEVIKDTSFESNTLYRNTFHLGNSDINKSIIPEFKYAMLGHYVILQKVNVLSLHGVLQKYWLLRTATSTKEHLSTNASEEENLNFKIDSHFKDVEDIKSIINPNKCFSRLYQDGLLLKDKELMSLKMGSSNKKVDFDTYLQHQYILEHNNYFKGFFNTKGYIFYGQGSLLDQCLLKNKIVLESSYKKHLYNGSEDTNLEYNIQDKPKNVVKELMQNPPLEDVDDISP